ncbi:MAG: hypothetical protein IJF76_05125 [Clostridia bacterium]|nr:hypothetical protein [Clostridia bacterium]
MENKIKTQAEIEQEIKELNEQFSVFLCTKGIANKFKLAFVMMGESAKEQRAKDKAEFETIKAKSREDNKEFVEFIHTKGFKAKVNYVIESIKKGAKEANEKTAKDIARVKAQTERAIHTDYTAQSLADEFNAFLAKKGLSDTYKVSVSEVE